MYKYNLKELIDNLDIVNIISSYIPLKKGGYGNFFGLCPFHSEKTPSFSVNFFKKFFYCFGCATHGNIIDFLIKFKKITFKEALKDLLNLDYNKINFNIKNIKLSTINLKKKKLSPTYIKKFFKLTKRIKFYYEDLLKKNIFALNYLKKRGFSIKTINYFNLGFCENYNKIESKFYNYPKEILMQTGLIKNLNYKYNILNNRIIFPINNIKGQTVGFAGRNINSNKPKYLNSKKTIFFKKKKILYGIWEARKNIKNYDWFILTEGFTDVLCLFQNNFKNVVGLMGSHITKYHFDRIFNLINKIIFCFDADTAGVNGIKNSIITFLSNNYKKKLIKFILLPKNFDPEKFLSIFGKIAFEKKLNNPISMYKIIYNIYIKYIYKDNNLILNKLIDLKIFFNKIKLFKYKKRVIYLLSKNTNINLENFFFILDKNQVFIKNLFKKKFYLNLIERKIIKILLIFPVIIKYFDNLFLNNITKLFKNKLFISEILNNIILLKKFNFIELIFKLYNSNNYVFYQKLLMKIKKFKIYKTLIISFDKIIFNKLKKIQKNFSENNILNFYKILIVILKMHKIL